MKNLAARRLSATFTNETCMRVRNVCRGTRASVAGAGSFHKCVANLQPFVAAQRLRHEKPSRAAIERNVHQRNMYACSQRVPRYARLSRRRGLISQVPSQSSTNRLRAPIEI